MRGWKWLSSGVILATSARSFGIVIYVDAGAPEGGDGLSWNSAHTHLQDAFHHATFQSGFVDEIRVGPGIYRPDTSKASPAGTLDRTATFHLPDAIPVIGGFAGINATDPDDWNPSQYETILSGDLLSNDLPGFLNMNDNSLHVLTCFHAQAMLQGCTIRGGRANGADDYARGAGVFGWFGTLIIQNCRFEGCRSNSAGGAVAGRFMTIVLIEDSLFQGNRSGSGGAVWLSQSDYHIRQSKFEANEGSIGGGFFHHFSHGILDGCDFVSNVSSSSGGGSYFTVGWTAIRNCSFDNNVSNSISTGAGGVHCFNVHSSLIGCSFNGNIGARGGGAGISGQDTVLLSCTFIENQAADGGGGLSLAAASSEIAGCVFHNNHSGVYGGALGIEERGTHKVTKCSFIGNFTTSANSVKGGGALWTRGETVIRNCRFLGNQSSKVGGAVGISADLLTMQNCLVAANNSVHPGGGIYLGAYSDGSQILNCTIAGNASQSLGGGVWLGSGLPNPNAVLTINNSVIWDNTDQNGQGQPSQVFISGNQPLWQYSCIQNLFSTIGVGNISANPMFVDPDGADKLAGTDDDNYALDDESPCIDAGSSAYVSSCSIDLNDAWRAFDHPGVIDVGGGPAPHPDMGAYETQSVIIADCNHNGFDDECDLEVTETDCDGSGAIDECEILSDRALDCNGNVVPDSCELTHSSDMDCNGNAILDECEIQWAVVFDCNDNDVPDTCDIGSGFALDCDGNGVPDECDTDCNLNGTPDACDIQGDAGSDCNQNGVLDMCEMAADAVLIYKVDDGTGEGLTGLGSAGDLIWLNQLEVQPGGEHVAAIDFAWGSVAVGSPTNFALWSDPNNDGNPSDAVLLMQTTVSTPPVLYAPYPTIRSVPVPKTFVGRPGQKYFVGVHMFDNVGESPAVYDWTPPNQLKSWVAGGSNLEALNQNPFPPILASQALNANVNWIIRARAGGTIDDNNNGIIDVCEGLPGDVTGNGLVDVDDLIAVINSWGPCPAPPQSCPADVAPKLPDGEIDVNDLIVVINNWS